MTVIRTTRQGVRPTSLAAVAALAIGLGPASGAPSVPVWIPGTAAECARQSRTGPNGGIIPRAMAPGTGGNVWFIESTAMDLGTHATGCLGLMDPAGRVREFALRMPPRSELIDIAADGTGGVWVLPADPVGRIGHLTPTGGLTWSRYRAGYANQAMSVTADGSGGAWFTLNEPAVGHVHRDGTVVLHHLGSVTGLEIAAGDDGSAWMIALERTGSTVRRVLANVRPEGNVSVTPLGDADGPLSTSIAVSGDGAVWFTDADADGRTVVVRRASGTDTRVALGLPDDDAAIHGLAPDRDGNMWFTVSGMESGDAGIGRITPAGALTVFRRGLARFSDPNGITVTDTGAVWFTEFSVARLGRVSPAGTITETPASPVVTGATGRRRAVAVRLTCPGTAEVACAGIVRLRRYAGIGATGRRAGERRFHVLPGGSETVTVPIAPSTVRVLRRTGLLRIEVLVRAASAATGHLGNETQRLVLVRG